MPAPSSPHICPATGSRAWDPLNPLSSLQCIIQPLAFASKALPGVRHCLRVEHPLRILSTSIRGHCAFTPPPSRHHILKLRRQRDRLERGARFES